MTERKVFEVHIEQGHKHQAKVILHGEVSIWGPPYPCLINLLCSPLCEADDTQAPNTAEAFGAHQGLVTRLQDICPKGCLGE